jgi:phosphatidylglycerol:prolipoprotein diacylglycerol transferase
LGSILPFSLLIFISAAFGARLLYVFAHPLVFQNQSIWQSFNPFRSVGVQGVSLLGALMTTVVVLCVFCLIHRIQILHLLDAMTPPFAAAVFIARMGCFLNGCCYGTPCDYPWCMIFPITSAAGLRFPGIPIHPTQLYAAFFGLLLMAILLFVEKKPHADGFLFGLTGILYVFFRLIVSPYKYSDTIHQTTFNQWMAFALIISGFCFLIFLQIKQRKFL